MESGNKLDRFKWMNKPKMVKLYVNQVIIFSLTIQTLGKQMPKICLSKNCKETVQKLEQNL